MMNHQIKKILSRTIIFGVFVLSCFVYAQNDIQNEQQIYLTQKTVSLDGARQAIKAAQEEAIKKGWHISVAVVDVSGQLVALEKNDFAIGVSPTVAYEKARTAALLKAPSKEFEQYINNGQPSFLATPGVTPLEGGIPIKVEGVVIGAVGVSGAHGGYDSHIATIAAQAAANQR
ncbi:GlcG/HbpS family heme-binding protein [Neisseria sp. Ec49-e6-T10]|uniref:GlcG/HbpS family heme-binding protein n=1 Tax=Neisseria sp. Ec49-e6-T10 TaxID=3140744 RepID=UPI003EB71285